MQVTVRFHAQAADLAGTREARVEVPETATCALVKEAVANAHPALAGLIPSSVLATDAEYLHDSAPIESAAALHLIPPVSGG